MKTLEQIVLEERSEIAKILGVSNSRLRPIRDGFLMKLSGITPKEVRHGATSWFHSQNLMKAHYREEVEYLSACEEILKDLGYDVGFHFSDQGSHEATLVLNKKCPCCDQ